MRDKILAAITQQLRATLNLSPEQAKQAAERIAASDAFARVLADYGETSLQMFIDGVGLEYLASHLHRTVAPDIIAAPSAEDIVAHEAAKRAEIGLPMSAKDRLELLRNAAAMTPEQRLATGAPIGGAPSQQAVPPALNSGNHVSDWASDDARDNLTKEIENNLGVPFRDQTAAMRRRLAAHFNKRDATAAPEQFADREKLTPQERMNRFRASRAGK